MTLSLQLRDAGAERFVVPAEDFVQRLLDEARAFTREHLSPVVAALCVVKPETLSTGPAFVAHDPNLRVTLRWILSTLAIKTSRYSPRDKITKRPSVSVSHTTAAPPVARLCSW